MAFDIDADSTLHHAALRRAEAVERLRAGPVCRHPVGSENIPERSLHGGEWQHRVLKSLYCCYLIPGKNRLCIASLVSVCPLVWQALPVGNTNPFHPPSAKDSSVPTWS